MNLLARLQPVLMNSCTTWTLIKKKKPRGKLYKDATCCFEEILETTAYKTAAAWPLTSHLTNRRSMINKTGTAGEARANSEEMFFYGLLLMDPLVLTDHQKLIFTSPD